MKKIEKDELYQNLCGFLKNKGVTLETGPYSDRLQTSCGLLADVINATQQTFAKAKGEVDRAVDQLRQSIHEATAPGTEKGSPEPRRSTATEVIIESAPIEPPKPKQSQSNRKTSTAGSRGRKPQKRGAPSQSKKR